jgi:hypothetical protein
MVGTFISSMLGKSMVLDLLKVYNADIDIRKDFENPEVSRFKNSVDGLFMQCKMDYGG